MEIEVKNKRGRKPIADKKQPLYIFIRQSQLEAMGGKKVVTAKLYELLNQIQ